MRELLPDIERWRNEGKDVALATVVKFDGSAPRTLGANIALSSAGDMCGSVSGGCVEGAVVQESLEILRSREPKLIPFGISNESAWEVGLACGGSIEVYVEPLTLK